jgi:hypothetical protein
MTWSEKIAAFVFLIGYLFVFGAMVYAIRHKHKSEPKPLPCKLLKKVRARYKLVQNERGMRHILDTKNKTVRWVDSWGCTTAESYYKRALYEMVSEVTGTAEVQDYLRAHQLRIMQRNKLRKYYQLLAKTQKV